MKWKLLGPAEDEAFETADWYDQKRLGLGDEFLDELQRSLLRIVDAPQAFAKAETYTGSRDLRRCLLERFPYLVIFEVRSDDILVVSIAHSHRRPGHWATRVE